MIECTSIIQVRYGETDQMGIVNNANYPSYYEIGRTDWLRKLGMSYSLLEEQGIMMPLVDLYSRYFKPAHFEDTLTIHSVVKEMPTAKIRFDHTIHNQHGELINQGYCQLAFMNADTRKPTRIPVVLKTLMEKFF
ncbi:acyl-CoA thioesterase [Carboxylicivirga linearis]|uniref:Acyl-CoA thioesterase n=1 Tax=Carboxylicivirga linearis TaxID=1628157 RepID=A0ABS5JS09_9BACT|nr:thioesterase family protein [Carboxylicivirga linearis]MBS2097359.1 acyl-CoA thioesterase [Carboxylicivirga linearis]